MTETVSLPLWLVFLGCALAVWALLDHLLLPSVRWYFRRRVNIVINQINKRLDVRLPAFELTKRRVIIDRFINDGVGKGLRPILEREKDMPEKVRKAIAEELRMMEEEDYVV